MVSSVKLPKSFVAINLSEKVPDAFSDGSENSKSETGNGGALPGVMESITPPGSLDG